MITTPERTYPLLDLLQVSNASHSQWVDSISASRAGRKKSIKWFTTHAHNLCLLESARLSKPGRTEGFPLVIHRPAHAHAQLSRRQQDTSLGKRGVRITTWDKIDKMLILNHMLYLSIKQLRKEIIDGLPKLSMLYVYVFWTMEYSQNLSWL